MTDQQTSPVDPRRAWANRGAEVDPARWRGWVLFGGVMMAVVGVSSLIQGVAVLVAPEVVVTVDASVLALDLSVWGWLHAVFGAIVCVTGIALVGGAPEWARGLGIGVTGFAMLLQMAWLPAHPLWSILLIVLDVLVLYALIVTWDPRAGTDHMAGRGAR